MQIGLFGLGRMGANVDVVAWNRNGETTRQLAHDTGIVATASVEEVVALLDAPHIVWLMLAGGRRHRATDCSHYAAVESR